MTGGEDEVTVDQWMAVIVVSDDARCRYAGSVGTDRKGNEKERRENEKQEKRRGVYGYQSFCW